MNAIYLKLDVNFSDDPNGVALLNRYQKDARAVRDLLVQMWCYCKACPTDGFVPTEVVGRLVYPDPPKVGFRDADRLVDVGIARRVDGGYLFPNWLKRNRSVAEIQALSAKRSDAGKQGGQRSGETRREANPKQNAKQVAGGGLNTEYREQSTENKELNSPREGNSPNAPRGTHTAPPPPPRCTRHTNTDDPGPCRGCQTARLTAERHAADELAARAEQKRNCPTCHGTGWHEDDYGRPIARCTHRTEHTA